MKYHPQFTHDSDPQKLTKLTYSIQFYFLKKKLTKIINPD